MSLRSFLLLAGVGVAACDLSDLTDGRDGGGGAGGVGGGGSGGTPTGGATSTGGIGGVGGTGGSCDSVETPFEWLIALGNDETQETRETELGDAALSSIKLAVDPNNGQLVVGMVTRGGSLLPNEPAGGLTLYVARFAADGAYVSHHAHPQPDWVPGPLTQLVIDDVHVHSDGSTILTGRRGGGSVNFERQQGGPVIVDTAAAGTHVFIAAFDQEGYLTDASHLQSSETGLLAMGPHRAFSRDADLFIAGSTHKKLDEATFDCPLLNTTENRRHAYVYSVQLQDGIGLGQCLSSRRFSVSNTSTLGISSAMVAEGRIFLTATFDLDDIEELELEPTWILASTPTAQYRQDALVMALDPGSLTFDWVSLIKSTGNPVQLDTASQSALVGSELWVAGASNSSNPPTTLEVSRIFSEAPGQPVGCTGQHPTDEQHANVIALDLDGNCSSVGLYGANSTANFILPLPAAPLVLGQSMPSSFPGQMVSTTFTDPPAENGYVVKPLANDGLVTVDGFMFGGASPVRVDDAVLLDGRVVVAGSMGKRFLNLTCPEGPATQPYDFYIGMVDPSYVE